MKSNKLISVLVFIFLIILAVAIINKKGGLGGAVACTMEAKICLDGSSVGRTGPKCEFSPCPVFDMKDWETFSSSSMHVSFQYPKDLGTTYIHTVDWPPTINATSNQFVCFEANDENAKAGIIGIKIIHGKRYCVTKKSEGAAGSTYTNYVYTTELEGKAVTLNFSLRSVQCGNYNDPEKTTCENERNSFNIDNIVNQMFTTIIFSSAPSESIRTP